MQANTATAATAPWTQSASNIPPSTTGVDGTLRKIAAFAVKFAPADFDRAVKALAFCEREAARLGVESPGIETYCAVLAHDPKRHPYREPQWVGDDIWWTIKDGKPVVSARHYRTDMDPKQARTMARALHRAARIAASKAKEPRHADA